MKLHNNPHSCVWLILIGLCAYLAHSQERVNAPLQPNPISEIWRWTELEDMRGNRIECGTEDKVGNLWFADHQGLYKYDGFKIEIIPYPKSILEVDSEDPNPLGDNLPLPSDIVCLDNGEIVIALEVGVYRIQNKKWKLIIPQEPTRYRTKRIVKIPSGQLIIGNRDGLYTYHKGIVQKHVDSSRGFTKLHFHAPTSTLWMGEYQTNKIFRCDWQKDRPESPENWKEISYNDHTNEDFSMCLNRKGELWVNTSHNKLSIIKIDALGSQHEFVDIPFWFRHTKNLRSYLTMDPLGNPMFRTRNAWYVQSEGKWKKLHLPDFPISNNHSFSFYRKNGNLIYLNRRGSVYEIHCGKQSWKSYSDLIFQFETEAHTQTQWFLRKDGRVITYAKATDTWNILPPSIDTPNAMIKDTNGSIWIYGSHEGVAAVARLENYKWKMDKHPRLGPRICYHSSYAESNGRVLFGSGIIPGEFDRSKGGVIAYDFIDNEYRINPKFKSISVRRTYGIHQRKDGSYLFGQFSIHQSKLVGQEFETTSIKSLRGLWVDDFLIDSNETLWVALWGIGVRKYDGKEYVQFDHHSELETNRVGYLLEDRFKKGIIWGASQDGLVWFQDDVWTTIPLHTELNMQRESGTIKQSQTGALWINHFHRDWYDRNQQNSNQSNPVFEDFRTYRFVPEQKAPESHITHYEESVSEDGDTFISWKGKDRWSETPSELLKYSYRVDNGSWSKFSKQTNVLLVDLSSGEHRFELKARDLVGNIQVEPAMVAFHVKPPIWQRTWFITVTSLGFLTVVSLITLVIFLRIHHIKSLEEAKIRFFTNISHELRNPLTTIEGPIESVLKHCENPESVDNLNLALKSTRKTIHLLDKLLDFRKSSDGKLEGHLVKGDLIEFIKETISTHQVTALSNHQKIHITCNQKELLAEFDEEQIPKIVDNLISNALKYSHENDTILVEILFSETSNLLTIQITDHGLGIPENEQKKIFDPFYRSSRTDKLQQIKSTGLGLPLVKELVIALSGEITVQSPVKDGDSIQQGSKFTVTLPIHSLDSESDSIATSRHSISFLRTILIVEDNPDILSFLSKELEKSYRVQKAGNGKIAWESLHTDPPEVVITDVMMPEMGGMELCSLIKTTDSTSHIPVFMLSAQDDDKTRIKGFEAKADDYISKPIKIDLLKLKLANLFENQQAITEKIKSQFLAPSNSETKLIDFNPGNHVLEKIVIIVLENISETDFDVEKLAKAMHMSRATLYRKIKGLTGDSTITFIQKLRMKQAAELLKTSNYSISEVAFAVGIQELSYFSACFKKYYKCTPSEYADGS